MASQGQAVRFRDCTCPGSPHDGRDGADDGDIVYLRDHLGFVAGIEAARMMGEAVKALDLRGFIPDGKVLPESIQAELNARMFEFLGPVYLREGPLSWNVVDESGPVPMTKDALLDLPYSQGLPIANRADELYSDEVASPLVKRTNALSSNGQTGSSTRPRKRSSSTHRKPHGSSSVNGTAGQPSQVLP